jgi:glucose/arabinose dehydrogenase
MRIVLDISIIQLVRQIKGRDERKILASQLQIPWSITKQRKSFYITERPGTIVKITKEKKKRKKLILTKQVYHEGEGGLLGMVLAPDFQKTGNAYVYHTYQDNGKI